MYYLFACDAEHVLTWTTKLFNFEIFFMFQLF